MNSKRKDELKKVLRSFSPKVKSLITEVVIDMCDLYRTAVEETLLNAQIVADHFHIIQDANRRIDSQRLLLQDIYKKRIPRYILTKNKEDLKGIQIHYLTDIIKTYPELNMFYMIKERLREMKLIKRISFGFRNRRVFIYKVMLSVLIMTALLPYLNS